MSDSYIPVSGGNLVPITLPGTFGAEYFGRQCQTLSLGFMGGIEPKKIKDAAHPFAKYVNGEWVSSKEKTGWQFAETNFYARLEVAQEASQGSAGTPTTVKRDRQFGWDAGAVSIPKINGNGGYQFSVPTASVGVVIGLADNYSGVGYLSIQHALSFKRGVVSVVNRGAEVTNLGPYAAADVFKIVRAGSSVHYYQNDILRHTETFAIGNLFYLAAATYMEGDAVEGAKVATVKGGVGSGTATLGPLISDGLGGFNAQAFGMGKFGPLSATGGAMARGTGTAQLGPISALGGHGVGGAGFGGVGPLGSVAEGGWSAPAWGAGNGLIGPLFAGGRILSGLVIDGIAQLEGVKALGSDRSMGQGRGTIGAVDAFGTYAVKLTHGFLRHRGGYEVTGQGAEGASNGASLTLPSLAMKGRFGHRGVLTLPKVKLNAAMTIVRTLQMELVGPSLSVDGSGITGGVARGLLAHAGRYITKGRAGARASMTLLGRYHVTSNGITGAAGMAAMRLAGRYVLDANGRTETTTVWALRGPALQPALLGQAWLVGPSLRLVASGGEIVEANHEAYSINIATGAVTRYTEFAFDNVLRFGDRFFGIRADGVYELAGDTDDGDPIVAQVRTFNTDFGVANIKRVPFVYVVGETGTDLKVGFTADKGVEYKYPVGLVSAQGVQTSRAKAGLGVKGVYYNFSITNEDGQAFQIDRLEAIVDSTTVVKG